MSKGVNKARRDVTTSDKLGCAPSLQVVVVPLLCFAFQHPAAALKAHQLEQASAAPRPCSGRPHSHLQRTWHSWAFTGGALRAASWPCRLEGEHPAQRSAVAAAAASAAGSRLVLYQAGVDAEPLLIDLSTRLGGHGGQHLPPGGRTSVAAARRGRAAVGGARGPGGDWGPGPADPKLL